MILTNKCIKYIPELTYDIFLLIWDKLEKNGYDISITSKTIYNNLKENWPYLVTSDANILTRSLPLGQEITIQEFLGYDPFKFILPTKWCVKVEANNKPEEIAVWRKTKTSSEWINPGYLDCDGWHTKEFNNSCIEITFDQFKKYVLKRTEIVFEAIKVPEFVLPFRWCVKVTEENYKILSDFKIKLGRNNLKSVSTYSYVDNNGFGTGKTTSTVITFDEFKKYVLKESDSSEIIVPFIYPEKWCIQSTFNNKDQINEKFNKLVKREVSGSSDSYWHYPEYGMNQCTSSQIENCYTPITFEQFMNFEKSINISKEKLLAKAAKDYPIGTKYVTAGEGNEVYTVVIPVQEFISLDLIYGESGKGCLYKKGKWAEILEITKEAYEMQKLNSLSINANKKVKTKENLEFAIECKSQEEWDFVCKYKGYQPEENWFLSSQYGKGISYCIYSYASYTVEECKKYDYPIISFDEWCEKYNICKPRKERVTNAYIQGIQAHINFYDFLGTKPLSVKKSLTEQYFPEVIELNFD